MTAGTIIAGITMAGSAARVLSVPERQNPTAGRILAGERRIARSSDLIMADVDGDAVMMSIAEGRYFGLDQIGSDIWRRLEKSCLLSELVDELTRDYDGDRATIERDVTALLERMAAHKLVVFS